MRCTNTNIIITGVNYKVQTSLLYTQQVLYQFIANFPLQYTYIQLPFVLVLHQ